MAYKKRLNCSHVNQFFYLLGRRWISKSGSDATEAVPIQQQASEHDHRGNQLAFGIVGVDISVTCRWHGSRCPVQTGNVVTEASFKSCLSNVLSPASSSTPAIKKELQLNIR